MKFAKANQVSIFRILAKEWERLHNEAQGDSAIELLGEIWDLKTLPSEDNRYEDAYGDVIQHYFRNDDWTTEYLFTERLKLYQDELIFQKFVEVILAPQNFSTNDQLTEVSLPIDEILSKDKLKLVTEDFNEFGLPIQKIQVKTASNDLPAGVKKNNIPFYVVKDKPIGNPGKEHFSLTPNKGWNDYSVVSEFSLAHHDSNNIGSQIGYLKIIYQEELHTWEHMPDQFFELSEDFCSLSGDDDYYLGLQNRFKDHGMISILYALQDAAFFPDICDRYERNSNFKHSLIRTNDAERMLRELKAKLKKSDLTDIHKFSYKFKPAYSEIATQIDFNFSDIEPLPDRILAVIGKNGTGKTQLLTALPNSLSKNTSEDFYNKIPSFTKIIAVSYSVFDSFNIPQKNATFNYVYCGLKDEDGDLRSNKGLVLSFHNNWKKIDDMRRTSRWRAVLRNFIDKDIINAFIVKSESANRDLVVSLAGFHSVKNKLSSGQSILLYIITQVVANIRVDSLILYDEPETHLHPNAIVELMNTIYELVNEFESYCLIATHSPIVIRELFSKNVYVMERDKNVPSVRRIGLESFGENLGVLTDEVFGDRQIPKQYKAIIGQLIRDGKNFDKIVEMLEFDDRPLSLNARIFIKNLIRNQDEEF